MVDESKLDAEKVQKDYEALKKEADIPSKDKNPDISPFDKYVNEYKDDNGEPNDEDYDEVVILD